VCGFQVPTEQAPDGIPAQEVQPNHGGTLAMNEPEDREELPEWRQELTRRLQEIKSRREGHTGSMPEPSRDAQIATATTPPQERPEPEAPPLRPPRPRKPRRAIPAEDVRLVSAPDAAAPAVQASGVPTESTGWKISMPENRTESLPAADVEIRPFASGADPSRRRHSQALIDTVIAKQPFETPGSTSAPEMETQAAIAGELRNDKLILMSRTLAGMVDLIIVVVAASSLIFAVDVFEGIEVFDAMSMVYYIMLLLMTYFLYSFFFLGTAGQTVGMMLTDLKITASSFRRPRASQIFVRCVVYLLGTAGLGLGLLWGCFDRQAMCLHDRLSRTQVTRIPFY
jgi:uncharacterized RDD family membrane protein YckC